MQREDGAGELGPEQLADHLGAMVFRGTPAT